MRRTMREIAWALAYVVTAALCFCGGQVAAQDEEGSVDSGLVRSYHFDRSGSGALNLCEPAAGCPTLGVWFDDAVAATYVPEYGGAPLTLTVAGNPTLVNAPTWPSGLVTPGKAWRLDGTADSLSVADAAGAFAPAGAWSVVCGITPKTGLAAGDVFAAKWNTAGDKRSWRLYTAGTSVALDISSDGAAGTIVTLSKAAAIAVNRMSWVTASCDGAGNCSIWVDGLAVAASAVMPDPFVGNAAFSIGADAEGAGDAPVEMAPCAFYLGAITAAEHTRMMQKFRGRMDSNGTNPVTVTTATMPAIQLCPAGTCEPFLIDQPANSNAIGAVVAGSGGLYGASAVTNLVQRSSFETWAAGAATGWTETPTSTGDATQNTTITAHGSSSMQLNCPGAADAITIKGACMTVTGGAVYSLSWFDYLVSGAGALDAAIYEDDSADCGSPTGHTTIGVAPIAATWNKRTSPYTMQAATIRAQLWFTLPAAAAQVALVDAPQLRLGVATDAFCTADTDASAVCSTMVQSVPDNGSLISINGSASLRFVERAPWAGTALTANRTLMTDGAAGAANNGFYYFLAHAADEPALFYYDSAGDYSLSNQQAYNWIADTDYTATLDRDGNGFAAHRWAGTQYSTGGITGEVPAASGTGSDKRTASQAALYLTGSSTAGADLWVRDFQSYRRMLYYDPHTLVVIGDSIAYSIALYLRSGGYYLTDRIIDAGITDNRSADVWARWSADALARGPIAVLLHVGVNDIRNDVTAAAVEANIELIADSCDAAGIKLIVDNVGTFGTYSAAQLIKLAALNAWLAGAFAAAHPTATVLDFLTWAENGSGDPKTCNAAWFDAPCLHPNATGYALWATQIATAVPTLW